MKIFELLRNLLTVAVVLVPFGTLRAQVVRYATDFPDAAGWTLDPGMGPTFPRWNVDATPASVLGALPYHSAPTSLNYNNGTCYGASSCVGITLGGATSPLIDITAPGGNGALTFWCIWDTETDGACFFDSRRVHISNDGFQTLVVNQCYDDPVCGPPGVWHQHTLGLQPSWGMIEVRFVFNTHDGMFNNGAGWFVDDMEVSTDCVPPSSYCTAKVNSQGCTPVIFATGYPTPTQPLAFRIRAAQVLNNKPGLLLYGFASAATPFQGAFLCITPPIQRIGVPNSGGNPPPSDCSGTYIYDFNDRIRAGTDPGLVPGADAYAQYWSRDTQDPFGSGLTDGLTFVICP